MTIFTAKQHGYSLKNVVFLTKENHYILRYCTIISSISSQLALLHLFILFFFINAVPQISSIPYKKIKNKDLYKYENMIPHPERQATFLNFSASRLNLFLAGISNTVISPLFFFLSLLFRFYPHNHINCRYSSYYVYM